eukprot:1323618-Lingulodinium_polyedra.AAC.1
MAVALYASKKADSALRVLTSFVCYLRPREADTIQVRDLVKPVGMSRFGFPHFAIVLHPAE